MSVDAFDRALAFTLQWEGGTVDHPSDPGGRTHKGISARAHPDAWADGVVTDAEVHRIYRESYWTPLSCDVIQWPLSLVLFDFGVHSGAMTAARALQRLTGAPIDGHVGRKTLDAIDGAYSARGLALLLCDARMAFLEALVASRPASRVFARGWRRRVADLARAVIAET